MLQAALHKVLCVYYNLTLSLNPRFEDLLRWSTVVCMSKLAASISVYFINPDVAILVGCVLKKEMVGFEFSSNFGNFS